MRSTSPIMNIIKTSVKSAFYESVAWPLSLIPLAFISLSNYWSPIDEKVIAMRAIPKKAMEVRHREGSFSMYNSKKPLSPATIEKYALGVVPVNSPRVPMTQKNNAFLKSMVSRIFVIILSRSVNSWSYSLLSWTTW